MGGLLTSVKHGLRGHATVLAGVAAGLIIGGSSAMVGFAAIPDSNGKIQACYSDTTGAVRIIDSASASCDVGETSTNWEQSSGIGKFLNDNFVDADLSGASLQYRDFRGVDMHGAVLANSNFTGSNLEGANLSGARLTYAIMKNANLQNANFTGANMYAATYFDGADLTGANFTGATFTNGDLTGYDLSDTTVAGATWITTYCPDATYSNDNGDTCEGHLAP